MATELSCLDKTVIVDTVVSSDDGKVRFEVYLPDEVGNHGSYSRLSKALLQASKRAGFSARSDAILKVKHRES